jgi:hypothetical protein
MSTSSITNPTWIGVALNLGFHGMKPSTTSRCMAWPHPISFNYLKNSKKFKEYVLDFKRAFYFSLLRNTVHKIFLSDTIE